MLLDPIKGVAFEIHFLKGVESGPLGSPFNWPKRASRNLRLFRPSPAKGYRPFEAKVSAASAAIK
ncbi:MAG: hypothetical protein WDN49_26485 [Acetobacteraceae bacterium]